MLIDVNRPLPLDTLVERAWGATPPRQASAALYSYISRLRALRVTPYEQEAWDIVRTPAGYLLRTDETRVDLVRFRSEVDQARTGTPEEAKGRYEQALALWRGRPFAGLKSDWLDGYRLTLDAEHLGVRLEYNELLLDEGRHGPSSETSMPSAVTMPVPAKPGPPPWPSTAGKAGPPRHTA
ncbi:BTAD domain-containing putative transcriptional regulator [Streptomyces sp. NBC_00009]|uniref:AfsR/SARP family transcriptional regulator n=1 Tax=Streptomyces sp. NBC_00009 TaxID=2975620 RepID=UPI00324DF41B